MVITYMSASAYVLLHDSYPGVPEAETLRKRLERQSVEFFEEK